MTTATSTATGYRHTNGAETTTSVPDAPHPSTDKAARRKRFEDVFPMIAEEMTGYLKKENMPQEAVDWYKRVCLCLTFIWYGMERWELIQSRTLITIRQEVCANEFRWEN